MPESDQSGRKKVQRNVITSWLSHLVFIAFGFIMPRFIDESIGQVALGIWDFGWAVVSYLTMAMIGIGSSVNRYVARYRASKETRALSLAMSSVMAIQAAIASGVFVIVLVLAHLIPTLMRDQLGEQADTAAVVVLYLGASLSVQMFFDVFRGILTGCHRWTTHNALNAGSYTFAATGMLIVLMNEGGLEGMAIVYLIVTLSTEFLRFGIARVVCPEIQLHWKHVNKADVLTMARFGLKTMLIFLPRMIIRQTISLFVVANLGVAMLAILARPLALTAHVNTMINKFAFVLTPTAGSLQGSGEDAELKNFALVSMRAGWILAILPTTFMLAFGDRIIDLWMGPAYVNLELIIILAAGSILPMAQSIPIRILVGMDEHGQIAKKSLIAAAIVAIVGLLVVSHYGWSLGHAAWLIVIPNNLGIGLVSLIVGCRVLRISTSEYCKAVLKDPIIVFVISLGTLLLVRRYGPQSTLESLGIGMVVHGIVSGVLLRKDLRVALKKF